MRWKDLRDWESMIDAATRIHDGYWPTSSPTPVPNLCGCTSPEAQCVTLAIAEQTPSGWYCTKPAYIPALQGATDCDRRIYDWKEGGTAQSGSKESKPPGVPEFRSADIMEWVRSTLDYLQANNGHPAVRICAGMLLDNQDVSVSMDTLERTGEAMLDRLMLDTPWKK